MQLIKDWIGSKMRFSLIFRGTRDSFNASTFHKLCDDKGPTICLIKSDSGRVFGGYTSISWKSDNSFYPDEKAFVFSLSDKTVHRQYQNKETAVFHYSEIMVFFGNGDLVVTSNSDQSPTSYSNLGMTYQPPEGLMIGDQKTKSYLAGSF